MCVKINLSTMWRASSTLCVLGRRTLSRAPGLSPRTPAYGDSFIRRAAAAGNAEVLLGPFASAGYFDACLEEADFTCESALPTGEVRCSFIVCEALANNFGTLHGGATATVVDVVGTLALLAIDPARPGISVEMNQSFCSAAKLGQTVECTGQVRRVHTS